MIGGVRIVILFLRFQMRYRRSIYTALPCRGNFKTYSLAGEPRLTADIHGGTIYAQK
jgi:hypothetical protein